MGEGGGRRGREGGMAEKAGVKRMEGEGGKSSKLKYWIEKTKEVDTTGQGKEEVTEDCQQHIY